jgi:sugar phosphate isomerase/epimerase
MALPFRYAICNEIFAQTPFAEACRQIRACGYEGIEIAPFTLSGDPAAIPAGRRAEIRSAIAGEGLCFAGLHWLLVKPEGLHLTTPDARTRQKSWEYLDRLIDLAGDLSVCEQEYGAVMVLGSPKQRSTVEGMSAREAADVLIHELGHLAPHAESRGIRIVLEALSPEQTDVVTSVGEAVEIVKQIGSPAIQTMFDTHNAVLEREPHPDLIRRYSQHIHHVHVNEMDGREPGAGDYDFGSILEALAQVKYSGWVSPEVFDFSRDPYQVASQALQHLKSVEPEAVLHQTV